MYRTEQVLEFATRLIYSLQIVPLYTGSLRGDRRLGFASINSRNAFFDGLAFYRLLVLKKHAQLFQSRTLCFWENKINEDCTQDQNSQVEDEVIVANPRQCDWVDILVHCECHLADKNLKGQASGANTVGQDLGRVAVQKGIASDVEGGIVQKQEHHGRVRRGLRPVVAVHGAGNGQGDIGHDHADKGRQPQRATADAVREQRTGQRAEEIPYRHAAVDARLLLRAGDADAVEDGAKVVRDDALAVPQGKHSDGDADCEPLAVAPRLERLRPGAHLDLTFVLESRQYLLDLQRNEFRSVVAVRMVLDEHLPRFFHSALGAQPARGFGHED